MTWDILIAHIPHRHDKLVELLDALAPQIIPGVGVIIYHDNLEASYGEKCQALVEASSADYVSHLSNDDMVAHDFVEQITDALEEHPDYVGFMVRHTEDGVVQAPVFHSLDHDGWHNEPEAIYRDLCHFNPIRRSLSMRVRFAGGNDADRNWASDLRELRCVRSQVFIPMELLFYQHSPSDTFLTAREPYPLPVPDLPDYPFVRYI